MQQCTEPTTDQYTSQHRLNSGSLLLAVMNSSRRRRSCVLLMRDAGKEEEMCAREAVVYHGTLSALMQLGVVRRVGHPARHYHIHLQTTQHSPTDHTPCSPHTPRSHTYHTEITNHAHTARHYHFHLQTRGVHGDGILVPSSPIPTDFTPIPPVPAKSLIHPHKPRIFFVNQRR